MTDGEPDPPSIRRVYDRIGAHFSQTRRYPWTDVTDFLETVEGVVGLDVGCGNGRHTGPLAEVVDRPLGIDLSRTLLSEATERAVEGDYRADFVQGTATSLPIGSSTVDVGLYIAAIHHLRSRAARIESLDELARVLSPGGTALLSSWCTTHDRFDRTMGFDTTVDWTLPDGETVARFYHIYDPAEFKTDVEASDLEWHAVWVSAGNCYARVGPR
ncbi:MAG: class I SAM-dependent methyltransferase [Halodesulfurarchaeum sp.]|nr:class I SAM-dependent methyltransferase [Halodesulfurarchaeum sp.]